MDKNVELATFHYPVLLLRYMLMPQWFYGFYVAVFLNLIPRFPGLFVACSRKSQGVNYTVLKEGVSMGIPHSIFNLYGTVAC